MNAASACSSLRNNPGDSPLRLSEIISALSYALDITEGQPQGHAARSCFIGIQIARKLGMGNQEQAALFYALLLKDLGCSSNAAKMCWLFKADDRTIKHDIKLVEWTSMLKSASFSLQNANPDDSLYGRLRHLMGMASRKDEAGKDLIKVRCERGADIARLIGFPEETSQAILGLDEHWDGDGHPLGLKGDNIPLLARICSISQTMEVFAREYDLRAARKIAKRRKGTWFDPELVKVFCSLEDHPLELALGHADPREIMVELEPQDMIQDVDEETIDRIALAFSQIVDAKSPWTQRHSEGVAHIAVGISQTLGYSDAKQQEIRRAGLLHDIGKLGVSNLILDKPGKLTDEEFASMRSHALHSQNILQKVTCFESFADYASAHHERLDGKGYHRGLKGVQVPDEARILAVADVCEALIADRPYRHGLSPEKVMMILSNDSGTAFCPRIVEALLQYEKESDLFTRLRERNLNVA